MRRAALAATRPLGRALGRLRDPLGAPPPAWRAPHCSARGRACRLLSTDASAGGPAAEAAGGAGARAPVEPPTSRQLVQLGMSCAVPFIGFGFADNLIMILAGDAIDATLGVALGLTTMAAAGFGNLISDVVGLGLGEMIEARAAATGLSAPKLSAAQFELGRTRAVKGVSGAVGISVGCLLGMFPLLLLGGRKHPIYLTAEEELLYATHFARCGGAPAPEGEVEGEGVAPRALRLSAAPPRRAARLSSLPPGTASRRSSSTS